MDTDFDIQNSKVLKLTSRKAGFEPKLWVVSSGKGGVGKTFVASSLGITLSKLGHSVLVLDLDLSGANVHTSLGIEPSHIGIRQFFDETHELSKLSRPTALPNLSYIQGFWDSWTPTDFSLAQISRLQSEVRKLKMDYVIIDLGAGALEAHLELLKHADEKILVSSPEPTSIEKTYRFIESYVCYALKEETPATAYEGMLRSLKQHRERTLGKPFSFKKYLKENSNMSADQFERILRNPMRLLVNSTRSSVNEHLGHSMKSVCNKYYDLSIDYMGHIDFDNAVWQCVSMREPVLISQPFTSLAGQFLETCKQLIDPRELRAVI